MTRYFFKSKIKEKKENIFWQISDSLVLVNRSIKHITRNIDQLFSIAISPLMFFLLFRYVFDGAIDTGGITYVNYIVAGALVEMLSYGSNYTTVNLAVDLQRGIVKRFRSLPISSSALLIGHVGADLVRNLISGLILIGISLVVGFHPTAGPLEWTLVIILAILFSLAISWISAILGLVIKSVEGAQWTIYIIIFPLTFVSSAFIPTKTMPTVLRFFAENQPLTQVINAIRGWLIGTPTDSAVLAFVWCIGIIIIAMPIAIWLFKRRI